MPASSPELPARYYAHLLDVLEASGIAAATVLKGTGLRAARLAEPEAQLRLDRLEKLLANARRAGARGDLGFELGRHLHLSSHSVVGYGLLASPSVGHALRLAARYFHLVTPTFRLRYLPGSHEFTLVFEPALPMSHACLQLHLEAVVVGVHNALHELLREALPGYGIELSLPSPAHARRYRELRGARVRFGVLPLPGARLRFPAELALRKPAMADPVALRAAEARCRALASHVATDGKFADWVRMMLRESADGLPSLGELSRTLNLSPRTLDRRLAREGTGFRALAREALRERVQALLAGGERPVTQIAHELGYRDAANFTRACRQLFGASPRTLRARRRGRARH